MIDLRDNCVFQLQCNDNYANTAVLNSRGAPHGIAQRNTNLMHVNGKIGGALDFDGAMDYVDIGSAASWANNSFTIGLWIKPDDGQPAIQQMPYGINTGNGILRFRIMTDGKVMLSYTSKSGEGEPVIAISSDTIFQDGQETWHHIIATVEKIGTSARANLYFDDVLVGTSGIIENANMSLWDDTGSLFVGNWNNDGDPDPLNWFSGSLDDVRIFNKALSQAEIDFLYNDGEGTERLAEGDCIRVYRGQDGEIDYENPVAEMELEDEQVFIGGQELSTETIWHYIRRRVAGDGCETESPDSSACIVRIDSNGDMLGQTPNAPVNLSAEGLVDAKIELRWRYAKLDEEIAPTGFHIYINSGSGFDFETPDATVPYRGGGPKAGEFDWMSDEMAHGEIYRFCVRSYRTEAGESQNTNFVSIMADSEGPDAITDLITTVEEL